MRRPLRRTLTYGNVTGTLALFIALGGTGYAATQIGTGQIKNGAVTNAKLHNGAVTASKLKSGTLPPSDAYSSQVGGGVDSVADYNTVVTSVNVPAGSYVVMAKLYAIANSTPSATDYQMLCALWAGTPGTGTQVDFTNGAAPASTYVRYPLQGAVTLASPGTLSLTCGSGAAADFRLYGISLAAIKVARLH